MSLRIRMSSEGCGASGEGSAVDYAGHFFREVAAFESAGRTAVSFEAAPAVPSCPGWVVTDLILHLGVVHRWVSRIIAERMQQPPEIGDLSRLALMEEWKGWLPPGHAPQRSPVPAGLLSWFHDGAADLAERFRATAPGEQVWTWSADHTVGFWQRMQAIEASVHRWDAENAVGAARPIDAALAADAIGQTFEVMAPMRRTAGKAPPGHGERFLFQRTDGPGRWAVRFDGDAVLLGTPDGHYDIQIAGTASDLALFLWQRTVTGKIDIQGDASFLGRYFVLVPPI
ncbi:MAG TPA: maleylpyruvate isomerase family mycothiol-dependent enzyme [Streptosporangiaceae bacterium]|nr:maleylpyruvate isomerase family mycothiol-dependent enzyme [Streptosporangiaceae bacterium]